MEGLSLVWGLGDLLEVELGEAGEENRKVPGLGLLGDIRLLHNLPHINIPQLDPSRVLHDGRLNLVLLASRLGPFLHDGV